MPKRLKAKGSEDTPEDGTQADVPDGTQVPPAGDETDTDGSENQAHHCNLGLAWRLEDLAFFGKQSNTTKAYATSKSLSQAIGPSPARPAVVSKVLAQYGLGSASKELKEHIWNKLVQPARRKGITLAAYITEAFKGGEIQAFQLPPPAPPASASSAPPASAFPAPPASASQGQEPKAKKGRKGNKAAPPSSTQQENKKGFEALAEAARVELAKFTQLELDVRKFKDPIPDFKVKAFDTARTQGIANAITPWSMAPAMLLMLDLTASQQGALTELLADPPTFQAFFNNSSIQEIEEKVGAPCVIGGYHSSKALILTSEDPKFNPDMDATWCFRTTRLHRFSQIAVDPAIPFADTYKYKGRVVMAMAEQDNSSSQKSNAYTPPGPAA
jgi:hypothetical protein